MKKFTILALLFLFSMSFAHAEEEIEYLFPVPAGSINVVNGYGGSDTHMGAKAGYSLDFQYLKSPAEDSPKYRKGFPARCYSLGMPVLASRRGKVSITYQPPLKELGESYGVHVQIIYPDGSHTWYGHMLQNTIAVEIGEEVVAGQILGLTGSTGKIYSEHPCIWDNNYGFQKTNPAPHIHLETNTKDKLKILQEPLIGKEVYRDIKEKEYTSATQMIDPTGHWAKFDALVPYEYTGSYVSMASRTAYKPRIQSITPSVALAGTRQTFTVKGENLPSQLYTSVIGCAGLQWHKQEPTEHQFSCTLAKQAQPRSGFIRLTSEGDPIFTFTINTLAEPEKETFPVIQDVQIDAKRGGERVNFKVTGKNLPTDLQPDLEGCTELNYTSATPTFLEFSCLLPHTVKDSNGKRMNSQHRFYTKLISASTNFSYQVSFTADYFVQVSSMQPLAAVYEQELNLILKGKNLDLARAVWVESCRDMQVVEHTQELIKVVCTPYKPHSLHDQLLPDWMANAIYQVVLKDEKDGEIIFNRGLTVSGYVQADVPFPFEEKDAELTEGELNLPRANDDLIQYILKAKGNYDNEFLKKVGWKKQGSQNGEATYEPENCNPELKDEQAQVNMRKGCLK